MGFASFVLLQIEHLLSPTDFVYASIICSRAINSCSQIVFRYSSVVYTKNKTIYWNNFICWSGFYAENGRHHNFWCLYFEFRSIFDVIYLYSSISSFLIPTMMYVVYNNINFYSCFDRRPTKKNIKMNTYVEL